MSNPSEEQVYPLIAHVGEAPVNIARFPDQLNKSVSKWTQPVKMRRLMYSEEVDIEEQSEPQAWEISSADNKNKYVGKKEGGLAHTTYAVLSMAKNSFRVLPVKSWYSFRPKIAYRTLSLEEAEDQLKRKNAEAERWLMQRMKSVREAVRADAADSGAPTVEDRDADLFQAYTAEMNRKKRPQQMRSADSEESGDERQDADMEFRMKSDDEEPLESDHDSLLGESSDDDDDEDEEKDQNLTESGKLLSQLLKREKQAHEESDDDGDDDDDDIDVESLDRRMGFEPISEKSAKPVTPTPSSAVKRARSPIASPGAKRMKEEPLSSPQKRKGEQRVPPPSTAATAAGVTPGTAAVATALPATQQPPRAVTAPPELSEAAIIAELRGGKMRMDELLKRFKRIFATPGNKEKFAVMLQKVAQRTEDQKWVILKPEFR